ncbi:MAG: NUDIX domain-containing protein [Polyangiales bacterium]
MPPAPTADDPIALAATVAVVRDGPSALEVLMVQRAHSLAFHGGAWVFPGGRVDPCDTCVDALATARRAAIREAREEAGLVLGLDDLVPFSHWTTPPGRTRRFATWFFAVALNADHDVVVDGQEITAHRWLSAPAVLALHARGDFDLPPPTFVTLTQFARFSSSEALLARLRAAQPEVFVPRLREQVALYAGDVAYEGGALDAPGPRHRLHMQPGGWRYEPEPEP